MTKFILLLFFGIVSMPCFSQNTISDADQRKALEVQYEAPTFSSPEIQDFAYDFILYVEELKKFQKAEKPMSQGELEKMAMDFNAKSFEMKEKMTIEDTQKFTDWSTKIAID